MKRREFFKVAAVCGAATLSNASEQDKSVATQENGVMQEIPLTSSPGTRKGDMLYRKLGRTRDEVSSIGRGGFHLGQHGLSDDDTSRLVRVGIERGVTFIDHSWNDNEGQSEMRMGKALNHGHRQ